MTPLTREEIRRACDVTGALDHEYATSPLALLEAWRTADRRMRSWSLESPLPVDGVLREDTIRACANDDSNPDSNGVADEEAPLAAAVRAVNAWAEARERKTP